MDVRVGLWRRLSAEELMLLNSGVGEDSWESLGLQGDQPWDFFGRTDAKAETPVLWPPHAKSWLIGKDWHWEGLGAGGEGDNRGWDGWMASLTWWMWVWVNSRSCWWTGKPGVLQFTGLQRVGHDWATDLIWSDHALLHGLVYHLFLTCQEQFIKAIQVNWKTMFLKRAFLFLSWYFLDESCLSSEHLFHHDTKSVSMLINTKS